MQRKTVNALNTNSDIGGLNVGSRPWT